MEIPVLVEPVSGNGFRARGVEPFNIAAEGATRDEAVENLRKQLQERLKQGSAIVSISVPTEPHPLAEFAGIFKDDPLLPEWKEAMAEYRRKIEEDPNAL